MADIELVARISAEDDASRVLKAVSAEAAGANTALKGVGAAGTSAAAGLTSTTRATQQATQAAIGADRAWVSLGSVLAGLPGPLGNVGNAFGAITLQLQQNQAVMLGVGAGLTALGVAGLGAFASLVSRAADFEQAMSQVKAVMTPREAEEFGAALSDLAVKLGRDTAYTAREAAGAIEELVKAGVAVQTILGGGARTALDLAAAGGIAVADAGTLAAQAINTFKLQATDLTAVADRMAGAVVVSAADMNDLRLGMQAAGAVINLAGGTINDATLALSAMANAGIRGSDAGTSVKVMYQELIPASREAGDEMQRVGLITADGANAFFDAAGKVKSYAEIAGVLETALAGMTEQQRLATIRIIFGTDAGRAAAVAFNLGAEGAAKLEAALGGIKVADVAAERLNNLRGDLEKLSGSWDALAIKLGGAQSVFRGPVQGADQLLQLLGGLPGPALQAVAAIGALGAALAALTGIWVTATVAGGAFQAVMGGVGVWATITAAIVPIAPALIAVGVALAALTAAWLNNWGDIQGKTTAVVQAVITDQDSLIARLGLLKDQILPELTQAWNAYWDAQSRRGMAGAEGPPAPMGGIATSAGAQLFAQMGLTPERIGAQWTETWTAFRTQVVHDLQTPDTEIEAARARFYAALFFPGDLRALAAPVGVDFARNLAESILASVPTATEAASEAYRRIIADGLARGYSPEAAQELADRTILDVLHQIDVLAPQVAAGGAQIGEALADGLNTTIDASAQVITEAGALLAANAGNVGKAVADALARGLARGDLPGKIQATIAEIYAQDDALKAVAQTLMAVHDPALRAHIAYLAQTAGAEAALTAAQAAGVDVTVRGAAAHQQAATALQVHNQAIQGWLASTNPAIVAGGLWAQQVDQYADALARANPALAAQVLAAKNLGDTEQTLRGIMAATNMTRAEATAAIQAGTGALTQQTAALGAQVTAVQQAGAAYGRYAAAIEQGAAATRSASYTGGLLEGARTPNPNPQALAGIAMPNYQPALVQEFVAAVGQVEPVTRRATESYGEYQMRLQELAEAWAANGRTMMAGGAKTTEAFKAVGDTAQTAASTAADAWAALRNDVQTYNGAIIASLEQARDRMQAIQEQAASAGAQARQQYADALAALNQLQQASLTGGKLEGVSNITGGVYTLGMSQAQQKAGEAAAAALGAAWKGSLELGRAGLALALAEQRAYQEFAGRGQHLAPGGGLAPYTDNRMINFTFAGNTFEGADVSYVDAVADATQAEWSWKS